MLISEARGIRRLTGTARWSLATLISRAAPVLGPLAGVALVGCGVALPAGSGSIFVNVAREAGVAGGELSRGAGAVVLDFDNDGFQDIFLADRLGPDALYRNNGDGTFNDVAMAAGVDGAGVVGSGGGCAADYDNDGDQDLYVSSFGPSRLYRNGGDGTFVEATVAAGLEEEGATYSTGCAWGDYDQDGLLDLVVLRHMHGWSPESTEVADFTREVRALALYHNSGDGTFAEVTGLLGDTSGPTAGGAGERFGALWGAGFQPAWVDFDNDGDLDLYVVNDFGPLVRPNVLFRNDGPSADGAWRFQDASTVSGADAAVFGMGLAVADYDLDGFLDFYMTNIGDGVLLRNGGDAHPFIDTTAAAGVGLGAIGDEQRVTWGAVFFDYDNDGDEDLYVVSGYLSYAPPPGNPEEQPNVLMRNDGGGAFTDVSSASGADDPGMGRGGVFLDFNNDGCIDLFVTNVGEGARLYQNRCDSDNNWLEIETAGTAGNRDGIGARITISVGGRAQIREVSSGASFIGQNMRTAHFGLGTATAAETVTIRWPGGVVQTLTGVAANQKLKVTEPK